MNEEIKALADKVTKQKSELRLSLLRKKCSEKGKNEGRIVLAREITLLPEEKKQIMKEAFDTVLSGYTTESRSSLKHEIGIELAKRKKARNLSSQSRLAAAIAEFGASSRSPITTRELAAIEEQLRKEKEYSIAVERLIQAGRAIKTPGGNLIIFNAFNEE